MISALLIIHGLVAVALLGAITHQTLAVWIPARAHSGSFFDRFRAVEPASFANAIVVLYATSAILGAFVYFHFCVHVMPALERTRRWEALGLLELKEHFAAIGLALLPAYWVCWRQPQVDKCARARAALTAVFCVHRLVGVPRWSRLEQHHGLWVMTSSPWFRRFAFAYGPAFAVLYVIALVRDLALFTVYPSLGIVLLGTHHSADIVSPSIAFAIPAMYWYG